MIFELLPTIDIMLELYQKPRSAERFTEYLQILQGSTKGDLAVPVSSFNPMAKEHVKARLEELKALHAEQLVQETLDTINIKCMHIHAGTVFKVALNIADDLEGGWTNHYTTDYDSKFKISALVKRHFCVPLLWASEPYTPELIVQRTQEYAYRTVYLFDNPAPKSLEEYVLQEQFVAKNTGQNVTAPVNELAELENFYKAHQDSTDFHIIFNFFYGDTASHSLEFPCYGSIGNSTGFNFVGYLNSHLPAKA